MMRGMYAAISGLKAHQAMLDVTANNLANVNTIGYKAQRTTFVDELSQVIRGASGPTSNNGGTNPMEVGLGVNGRLDRQHDGRRLRPIDGQPARSGDPGPRLLPGGQQHQHHSRRRPGPDQPDAVVHAGGQFHDQHARLPHDPERPVRARLPGDGARRPVHELHDHLANGPDNAIKIPTNGTDIAVGQDGSVTYVDPADGLRKTAGYISLASFPNEAGLERVGGSLWQATANSGAATAGSPGVGGFGATISGELEMSNVDIANEFTNMITAQRGFQANSRVITTADEMLQTLVNMKQ